MRRRLGLLPTLITLAAIAAAFGWQHLDLRQRSERHRAAYREHGEALWKAVEGVVAREFRGGQFDPRSLASALAECLTRFDLRWIAIEDEAGNLHGSAGHLPERAEPDCWFEHAFVPLRPLGRGPRRPADAGFLLPTPTEALTLQVALRPEVLAADLAADRRRAITTSAALALVITLLAAGIVLRTRRAALQAELASNRRHLEGLETLRRLGAGLVHETKNPLGVVRGFAERIVDGRLAAADLTRAARAIVEETDRTVARLDEFLLLSRPARLRRVTVPLPALCRELATLLRSDFEAVGANLVVRAEDVAIEADRDQLRRLLMNLLLNAAQAVGEGTTVELVVERTPDHTRIVVADDGPGVPEALRETLFLPYVSGRPGGTGLGLAIARRIALDHGFDLRHEPVVPHGARMVLEVPA